MRFRNSCNYFGLVTDARRGMTLESATGKVFHDSVVWVWARLKNPVETGASAVQAWAKSAVKSRLSLQAVPVCGTNFR